MSTKRTKTPLKQQLISALKIYAVFLKNATDQEKAKLDERLRSVNLNFSIYDPINVMNDLFSL